MGHDCMDHNYTGHNYTGHNYTDHNYMGHDYVGHNYIPGRTAFESSGMGRDLLSVFAPFFDMSEHADGERRAPVLI